MPAWQVPPDLCEGVIAETGAGNDGAVLQVVCGPGRGIVQLRPRELRITRCITFESHDSHKPSNQKEELYQNEHKKLGDKSFVRYLKVNGTPTFPFGNGSKSSHNPPGWRE